MIHELNEKYTRVKASSIYHTSNIIKYKRGEAFYFFKEMKTMVLYNKKTDERETVVRFEYHRTKQSSYNYNGKEHWGITKHDFFNGEKFSDRFEFVNFNDIPEGEEKDIIVKMIKKNVQNYNFGKTNYLTKVMDDTINHYMGILLETRKNGGRDYEKEEREKWQFKTQKIRQEQLMEHFSDVSIRDSLEICKAANQIIKIHRPKTSDETIILKKHTHKRNNKIVLTEPVELGVIMSPPYIASIDTATTNVADFMVTKQYIADQMNNAMGIPENYFSETKNIVNEKGEVTGMKETSYPEHYGLVYPKKELMSRYANTKINDKYYGTIKFGDSGTFVDNMIVLSRNKKKTNNKVCMLEDKLVIL